jgi:hypothetical protein
MGADHPPELRRERVHGLDGRTALHRLQQATDVQPTALRSGHPDILRNRAVCFAA